MTPPTPRSGTRRTLRIAAPMLAALGLLALLALLWAPEPERNVCGSVSALNLSPVPADAPLPRWRDAVAQPGRMQEMQLTGPPLTVRYRYFEPGSPVTAEFYANGETRPWTADNTAWLCDSWNRPDSQTCRFDQDGDRYGLLSFRTEHIVEISRDDILSRLYLVQGDGAHLEVFVTTKGTPESAAEM